MAALPVPIEIETRKVDTGETMVTVIGEIDLATAPAVQKRISRLKGNVVIDLRKVAFMDSTGIRMLIQERERLGALGSGLRVLATDAAILRLFELSGLSDVFQVDRSLHPSIEEPPTEGPPAVIAV
jgi:anti-sigma B factor antagonist